MHPLRQRVQDYLDRRGRAFETGDFDAFLDMVVFPQIVVTRTAVLIVEDEDKLRTGFDAWANMLRTQQVSVVAQTVKYATEMGDDLVSARWITRLLRGATPICPAYKATGTFRDMDGTLRCASMTLGMKNLSWPITIPRVDGDGETLD